jgi:predicted NAD-dependent protein-ADP-ribosyltransferase YbiA (DUF1768 family)
MNREYIAGEDHILFHSNAVAPYHLLSNFSMCEITYDGITYPSVEHAFQSQLFIREQRHIFSIHSDVLGFEKLGISESYWMKKEKIGILAKSATSTKNRKKLGLVESKEKIDFDKLWIDLLTLKFQNDKYNNVLMNTQDKYLLEFDRRAKVRKTYWGGIIDDNILYGENKMGKYLMCVRSSLRK